ncbi:MAG: ADP-heptose:LPS heptosyltransferase, partial [Pseudohongiellaceae bacterium]
MDELKTDCRHFNGDRPCKPHKLHGVVCSSCVEHYDPVETRILITKLAAMGDVLRTTSLLPAIHRRWPRASITWVTSPSSIPLVNNNPLVDRTIPFTGSLPLELATEHFDVVLNPDAAPDSCALAQSAKGDLRVGFAFDQRGAPVPLSAGAAAWLEMGVRDDLKKANVRTYQDMMADVLEVPYEREPPQLPISAAEEAVGAAFRSANSPAPGKSVIGLNTGAGGRWRFKRWTEEGYIELIERLGRDGHKVFLLGGPEEVERNSRLAAASNGVAVDTGCDNTVGEFAGIVDACDVVLTGDTLAMHVAIARGTPVVVLFGPTSLHEIDVFDRGERIAPEGLDCLVCYLPDCDVRPHCMESISVNQVHQALLGLVGAATV